MCAAVPAAFMLLCESALSNQRLVGIFFSIASLLILRQGLSLNLELVSKLPGSSRSTSTEPGVWEWTACLAFCLSPEDLNSHPEACVANTFPLQSFPADQPPVTFLHLLGFQGSPHTLRWGCGQDHGRVKHPVLRLHPVCVPAHQGF